MPPKGKEAAAKKAAPAKLSRRLVLNGWMLRLFEAETANALLDQVKDPESGGLETAWTGEDGVSYFHRRLTARMERERLSHTDLLRYDENIVRHWRAITDPPDRRNLVLKHFQYLALLFTEFYLDRYFSDQSRLLADLNEWVETWNAERDSSDQADPIAKEDLNKLAFWMATGSGKTLLMHVNIKQYLHYLGAVGKRHELNRIILLTPNEGLSRQHLDEFAQSGMDAAMFSKDGRTLFTGHAVEIIDIHKLAEEQKEKTVAVDAFEGNNLVLVDEGHRGSSTEVGVWMDRRRRLCEQGFSLEYSATFGQAIRPASRALIQEYGHCILFDYSYRYFHRDGYGKEFQILNLQEQRDEEQRLLYMTGGLLAFQQQLRVFRDEQAHLAPYGLERPLWVFVGSKVTATTGQQELSDILLILQFLHGFLRDRAAAELRVKALMAGAPGLTDGQGREIFANRLRALFAGGRTAAEIYDEALTLIFNAPGGGALHIEQLRGGDAEGEIELRVGNDDPFGVVNVGDAAKVVNQCSDSGLLSGLGREFGGSLFRGINNRESTVNVLIGAKKFTEGWSSWRVSTMGLMNVGKSEGSEIIQLFGRGVRLRGLGFSLKRSPFVRRADGANHPHWLPLLETLNVFGIKADYMQTFREILEEEGIPPDDDFEEVTLNVINHIAPGGKFADVRLWTLKLKDGKDFKRDGPKPVLESPPHEQVTKHPVIVDWYPRIQARRSRGLVAGDGPATEKASGTLTLDHLVFLDFDAIWFELQRYKAEKSWYNLAIPREAPRALLEARGWYDLLIQPDELRFTGYDRIRVWQEIAVALLRKYCERYYRLRQTEWEKDYLEYRELSHEDGKFFELYTFRMQRDQADLLDALGHLQNESAAGSMHDRVVGTFEALAFDRHLYTPLIHLTGDRAEVTPIALNRGERNFVRHLEAFIRGHATELDGREIFLLRNLSRGKGIGFFEAGGFYPDFILWVKHDAAQHISFIDPKGLRNLTGLDDPKVRLAATIKEHEARLASQNPNVTLDAFLISETPYQSTPWAGNLTLDDLEAAHVLFPGEDATAHIRRMFEVIGALPAAG